MQRTKVEALQQKRQLRKRENGLPPKTVPSIAYVFCGLALMSLLTMIGSCTKSTRSTSVTPPMNAQLAKQTKDCRAGHNDSCLKLAMSYFAGTTVKQDMKQAEYWFLRYCDKKYKRECLQMATAFYTGIAVPFDGAANMRPHATFGTRLFQALCTQGHQYACHSLGMAYIEGRARPQDTSKGFLLIKDSCDSHVIEACHDKALLMMAGIGTEPNFEEGHRQLTALCQGAFRRSCKVLRELEASVKPLKEERLQISVLADQCQHATYRSCYLLADILNTTEVRLTPGPISDAYGGLDAKSSKQNQIAWFYHQACDHGVNESCVELGIFYREKVGGWRAEAKAKRVLESSCKLKYVPACVERGKQLRSDKGATRADHKRNQREAAILLEKACRAGNTKGCHQLGLSYFHGMAVSENRAQATKLFRKACNANNDRACYSLGMAHYLAATSPDEFRKAVDLFTKLCSKGHSYGCHGQGLALYYGKGTAADPKRAAALFQSACQAGHAAACYHLAIARVQAKGVPAAPREALPLLQQACDNKVIAACDHADETPEPNAKFKLAF